MQFGSASLSQGKENDKCSFQGSGWQSLPTAKCHPDITMTTTKRLPSSKAKTIEILIKAIPFFFFFLTNGRKTTKYYPEIHDQAHFQNSKILLLSRVMRSVPTSPKPSLLPSQQLKFYRSHKLRLVQIFYQTL